MSAQVPGYVPQDGLVAWYSLNGNGNDQSGNENHLIEIGEFEWAAQSGVPFVEFEGEGQYMYHPDQSFPDVEEFSISIWFRNDQWSSSNGVGGLRPVVSKHYSSGDGSFILYGNQTVWQVAHDYTFDHEWETDEWHHVAASWTSEERYVYADGELVLSESADFLEITDDLFMLGGWLNDSFSNALSFDGGISSVGLWDRGLSQEEVNQLYSQQPGLPGCMASNACNFNSDATYDDGSCDFFTCLCLDGTIWSEELGGCIPATTCPQDLDYDGVVGVNDLMNLLSAFGTPCEPPAAASTCGEPVTYRGYDYETVLIGDKCWFAENLRATKYLNGAEIENLQGGPIWLNANEGETGGWVDFANDTIYGALHGKMYNGYAVTDERGLCPPEWHVSTDLEWDEMIQSYGGEQLAGTALKDDELWNGDNTSGFSGLAGGFRDWGNAAFFDFGWTVGTWWTVNHETGTIGTTKRLIEESGLIYSFGFPETNGSYVRCIKD